ncbi:thiol methyltransferase 1 [Ramaria rubella]|nr:thiol methyltransferase 1 [Ramaria rubella]
MAAPFKPNDKILRLQEIVKADPLGGWDKAWISGTTPWDAGCIQPPLEHLLQNKEIIFPTTGRALVPGCGKGYDAIFIGSYLGLETTGIDISPTAVAFANKSSSSRIMQESHSSKLSNVSFELHNFFDLKDPSQFDLIYDYTFFQALPPSLRVAWGEQMSNITRPGGYLIILAYPVNASKDIGPPYGIEENSHQSVLGNDWVKLIDRIPKNSSESHVGQDRLLVWRKKL